MVARSELTRNDWYVELAALMGLMVLAGVGHLVLLVVLVVVPNLFSGWGPPEVPEDAIQVSLVSMPATDSDMAQMDVRVETAPAPVDLDAPEPTTEAGRAEQGTAEPEVNPNPSDLAFQTPDAAEAKGDPTPDNSDARADALREIERQNMLAALGEESSTAGDPDSTSDQRIDRGGSGIADPELAAYEDRVERAVMSQFRPLPTLARDYPDLLAIVVLRFDPDTGVVQSWSLVTRSGNPSWDGAAERAAEAVSRLPVPPAKHRDRYKNGFRFSFDADKM